ncbi:MAG: SPFH domain-containing protein [Gemmatimonadales bacterium]|jgi:regulator of protease activity HflC (stomatin/prohibitin superfamily)
MFREVEHKTVPGFTALILLIAASLLGGYALRSAILAQSVPAMAGYGLLDALILVAWGGLFMVNPNQAKVLQLFGRYVGSVKTAGLNWANPFFTKRQISLRVRNFETAKLKVNDRNSNPVEIAAIVVWQVVDTAEAMFEVDNYENYVHVQSESALRNLASQYPYDAHQEGEKALATHTAEIAERLQHEIQDRLAKAGVAVREARFSHLAYAPEIAGVMLRRQQANAIIAARQRIVEGAVGMVEMALDSLSKRDIVHLDEERKATMVSNLLVVLCSEQATQPVVNTGTLYR